MTPKTTASRQQKQWAAVRAPLQPLPQIIVTDRPLRAVTDDALAALVDANARPVFFIRRGTLARVRCDERGRPFIEAVSDPMLRHRLARVADFVRVAQNGTGRHVSPPADVVGDLLAHGTWHDLPPLEAVTEVPVLRADGSIVDTPGYDSVTRLVYLPPAGTKPVTVPSMPTLEQATTARDVVHDLLIDFPFTNAASRANMFALLLTPIVRPAIDGVVPLALLDKPKRGTGASLLANMVQLIATGSTTELMTAPASDEEWRKKITAALLDGATVLLFDNVEHPLSSAQLSAALTSPDWKDRRLGHTEMVTAPNRATWVATGNNIRVGGDIARRSYWIRLDAQMARPWQRKRFRHPRLLQHVREHRHDVIGALLTMARFWFASGRPAATVPALGGFENWTTTVGGILAAVGVTDFLVNLEELYEQVDDDEHEWVAFLTTWHKQYGKTPKTVNELMGDMKVEASPLAAVLPADLAEARANEGKGKGSFSRCLGKALSKRAGAVFDAVQLVRDDQDDKSAKAARWIVQDAPPPAAGLPGFPDLFSAAGDPDKDPSTLPAMANKPGKPGNPVVDRDPGQEG
jgi:hypothetical protein